MKSKLRVAGLAGIVLAAGWARADTYTINGDQTVIGTSDDITFAEEAQTVSRTGSESPYSYHFGTLSPAISVLDLSEHKIDAISVNSADIYVFDLAGAALQGDDGVSFKTYAGNNQSSQSITITNATSLVIGTIDTRVRRTGGGVNSGSVRIGSESDPIPGLIRIQELLVNSVTDISGRGTPGRVYIYGDGDVLIQGADNVLGDIDAGEAQVSDSTQYDFINVYHQGTFKANKLDTSYASASSIHVKAGDIVLDGGDSSGHCEINEIQAYGTRQTFSSPWKAEVVIGNYSSVVLGSVYLDYRGSDSVDRHGGDLFITNNIKGDITINGVLDLGSLRYDGTEARRQYLGDLMLACDGTITLLALDMDKARIAGLDSGSGGSEIIGEIANFDTNSPVGSGTKNDPYVSAETSLRAPEGQYVYYKYTSGTLNDALGGHAWRLRNMDDSGGGGILMVQPARGTVIRFR